jgi:hypothetical protein
VPKLTSALLYAGVIYEAGTDFTTGSEHEDGILAKSGYFQVGGSRVLTSGPIIPEEYDLEAALALVAEAEAVPKVSLFQGIIDPSLYDLDAALELAANAPPAMPSMTHGVITQFTPADLAQMAADAIAADVAAAEEAQALVQAVADTQAAVDAAALADARAAADAQAAADLAAAQAGTTSESLAQSDESPKVGDEAQGTEGSELHSDPSGLRTHKEADAYLLEVGMTAPNGWDDLKLSQKIAWIEGAKDNGTGS